jgi:hypothetical protein
MPMSMLAVLNLEEIAKDYDAYDDVDAWRNAGNNACERTRRALEKITAGDDA